MIRTLAAAALVAIAAGSAASPADVAPVAAIAPSAPSAQQALALLPVKGRAPKTSYSRDQFGPAWTDVDHNQCSTRNDVLRRDLTAVVLVARSRCDVASGRLADPYTGRVIPFRRGTATSRLVQIDHVVALGDAWVTGASGPDWTPARRLALANDPLNLLAVDGPTNEAKGDSDAASWLPPDKTYRCRYVSRQIAVKVKYGLWLTPAERDAIGRVLGGCPRQGLPR